MGRRTRPITIYRTRPKHRSRLPFKFPTIIPTIYVLTFFAVITILSFITSLFLLTSHSSHTHTVLSSQIVNLHTHPDIQTFHSFPMTNFSTTLTMSTPRPEVIQPQITASETAQPNGDYCLRLPIIMYHHVQPLSLAEKLGHAPLTVDNAYFDEQMAYLEIGKYHAITSSDLIHALLNHTNLPEKSVMLTFDDGYDDMYAFAFPILLKHHLLGNFMIPTGLIGVRGYLTWDELKDMQKSPYVRIYNHTWSHADLAHSSHDKIESEMTMSQSQLETNLGIKPDIMAYPYGSFNDEVKDVIKAHGFIGAFSTIGGLEQCESQIFELRRIHAGNTSVPPLSF